jgi:hypothetical protein
MPNAWSTENECFFTRSSFLASRANHPSTTGAYESAHAEFWERSYEGVRDWLADREEGLGLFSRGERALPAFAELES